MNVVRSLVGLVLAIAVLAMLVPHRLGDPQPAFQRAVARALASDADDRLLEAALDQYPDQAPAIVITYGHLDLFREQLARFGPQVVPIVATYQDSLTTADAWRTLQSVGGQLTGGSGDPDLAPLSAEERGLLALLKMRDEGNAFVGQWELTDAGAARRVPSRLITLGGPELLFGGLTALEREVVRERPIDWQTYGLAAVDVAAIGAGVALLRFAGTAARGASTARAAAKSATVRSGALAAAKVLGINAVRIGVPAGLIVLLALHPDVFTHYAWIVAESLGMPGILGPVIGWGIVILPLAFLLSWLLLSVRMLRLTGSLLAGAARGCRSLALRLAAADDR